jgi:predicted dehydrogenase
MARIPRMTRRTLVRSIAFAGAAMPLQWPRLLRAVSPNGKVRYAPIGADGMGYSDFKSTIDHPAVQVVALCDVDESRFAKAAQERPDAPRFQDFRVMLDQMDKQIDAVSVSIPDHMHAYVALEAMRRGKHVYCQKPLAHTVWECRQMARMAAKTGRVTRMGNQIHSKMEYRLGARLIQDGVIGKVREVHSWVAKIGNRYSNLAHPPSKADPVPGTLDWTLWLGVSPHKPYVDKIYHPQSWRDWKQFGSGCGLGDFGCHILDPVFTALQLTAPITITAEALGVGVDAWPTEQTVRYVMPGTRFTADKTLTITWYDGMRQPDARLAQLPEGRKLPASGSMFIGTEGVMILPHWSAPQLYPMNKYQDYKKPEVAGSEHRHDWINACLSGDTTISDTFAYAGPLTETVQLGNIASRFPGRTLQWDAATMKLTGADGAGDFLTKDYRKGWEITAVA